MTEKSIAIIGAGLAGLAVGCYAQMNGYRTRIFEQSSGPGGVCTAWQRQGYTVDGCIHWLMGASRGSFNYQLYQQVGALDGNRLCPLNHFNRIIVETTGTTLDYTADLDLLEADMKAPAPRDGPVIDEILAAVHSLQGASWEIDAPRELTSRLASLRQAWRMRKVIAYSVRYRQPMSQFALRIRQPGLRWAVANFFLPSAPMVFMLFVLGQLADGQLASVVGGSAVFARAIARRCCALGGEILYGAPVERILVEADRAVGVRLVGGSEHRRDVVVSAADGRSTIFDMLGGRYLNGRLRDLYQNWPLFPPLILASYGVARRFADQPVHNTVALQRPLVVGLQRLDSLMSRVVQDPTMNPPGKTVVQAILQTDFNYWWRLHNDRTAYEAAKERVAAEVLDRLESHLPGLSSAVEMIDVATPYTFWRYSRNHRGAFEGWLLIPRAMAVRFPKTLTGLTNFYMAGQWVEPGGGIPAVLHSGRQVAQIICWKDGKQFQTPD